MATDLTAAKKWIDIAIRRHERHMKKQEPTTGTDGEISQKLMMEEMVYTKKNIEGNFVTTSYWYDANIGKFPDKPSSGGM